MTMMTFHSLTVKEKIAAIAVISLLIHILAILFLTHLGDPEHWPRIIQTVNSGNGIYGLDGNYYTPLWGYLLSFMDMLIQITGSVPFFGDVFSVFFPWEDVPGTKPSIVTPQISFVTKIPMAICDIIVGYMIFKIVSEYTKDEKKGVIAMALWCFCPMVIYMSSVQGQFDSISTLLVLLTIRLLREDRPLMAGIAFGFTSWLKLFPSVCLFLFVGYLIKKYGTNIGIKKTAVAALGAVIVTVIILLPQMLNGELPIVFGFFTGRAGTNTEFALYNSVVKIRLVLMLLLTLVLMVWSFIGIQKKEGDLGRYLYLYAGVLITVATIISRGYQYVPSFIVFILLFAMISDDRRSYRMMFCWIGVLTIADAFFSVGPSVLSMDAVYYGFIDPAWLESVTVTFLTTIGHSGSTPIGVILAITWAIMLWFFVLFGVSDLMDDRYPRFRDFVEKFRLWKRGGE